MDSLLGSQDNARPSVLDVNLIVHIGYVSGEYTAVRAKEVWRVNPDGELRDVFGKMTDIFEMEEIEFFKHYSEGKTQNDSSVLHLGFLNTLRSRNFFDIPDSVTAFANTGGFSIDGDVSSLVGASLADKDKLYSGIFGDLAFFYDMNVLGNQSYWKQHAHYAHQ